jgi:hypothetical protein
VVESQPCPLQEFCPLQAELAVLHSDWPLQAFTPEQWTLASWALTGAKVAPVTASERAAAARTAPDLVMCFMGILLIG